MEFVEVHDFEKPNDGRALRLMNVCATYILEKFGDAGRAVEVRGEHHGGVRRPCRQAEQQLLLPALVSMKKWLLMDTRETRSLSATACLTVMNTKASHHLRFLLPITATDWAIGWCGTCSLACSVVSPSQMAASFLFALSIGSLDG